MKLYKYLLSTALVMSMLFVSCEEDEDLLTFSEADNDISFPGNLDEDASFTDLDAVIIDVAVNGTATSLSVSGGGQNFGDISISSDGMGTFSSSLANLGYVWTDAEGDPTNDFELAFSDGETRRLFDISVISPITFNYTVGSGDDAVTFSSSSTVNLDSAFNIYFEAATDNATIDNYSVYTKIGNNSDYPATSTVSEMVDALMIEEEEVNITAENSQYDIGDTIYYELRLTSGSLISTAENFVVVEEVQLVNEGTVTLRTPDYAISSGVTDSLNNAFNFSELKIMADSVLMSSPDSADIRLVVSSGNLNLEAGSGSNTQFVVADENFSFSNAGYESVRDAFVGASNSVDNIETLSTNPVILVQIGNIPNDNYPSADNKRYAVIQITDFIKSDNGVTSEVTFDYKAPEQAEE